MKKQDPDPVRDTFGLLRDASLLLILFLYIVGFEYRYEYLRALGFGGEFSVDSIFDLIAWADRAAEFGTGQFIALFLAVLLVLVAAAFLRTEKARKRPHADVKFLAAIGTALVVAYGGGFLIAYGLGKHQASVVAPLALHDLGGTTIPEFSFQRRSATVLEADCAPISKRIEPAPKSRYKHQYYIVDETRDHYVIMSRRLPPTSDSEQPTAMAIRKDDILCYEMAPSPDTPGPRPTASQIAGRKAPAEISGVYAAH